MSTKTICILDKDLPLNESFYEELKSKMDAENIAMSYCAEPTNESKNSDIILLAAPIDVSSFSDEQRIMGLRTTNRKERLMIAEKIVTPNLIAKWASPENDEELSETLKEWDTDTYIFKYDWSAGRRGVRFMTQGSDSLPEDYSSEKDIVMEYLNDDPITYKADLCCGVLLNAWLLRTKDINDGAFNEFTSNPTGYELPPEAKLQLETLSAKLMKYGGAYISVDLMKYKGEFKIIEINTNCVGRNISWQHFRESYLKTYPLGIKNLLENQSVAPTFEELKTTFSTKEWLKAI